MTQPKALVLDEIIRIYKNSSNQVLGIHTVGIHEQREPIPNPIPNRVTNTRFKRTALRHVGFDRFNLSMGSSRTIAIVQMIGRYDDFTYNIGQTDIIAVEYFGNNETNSIEIDLSDLPTLGDTI